jgi:hypothetical protein
MTPGSEAADSRTPKITGWRLILLYFYCVLLTTLAAILATTIATAPHWIHFVWTHFPVWR